MTSSKERLESEWLVLRCQEGDTAAFERLVEEYQERLWRHARRIVADEDVAWDVLQETWIAVGRGIRRLEHPAAFPGWVYRIASNKCRDWIRREERRRNATRSYTEDAVRQAAETAEASDPRAGDESVETLKEALEHLTGPDRALLSLRYEESFSLTEISAILDIPEGTVKSRLHHARQRLRTLMEVNEDE